jgi:hypothetical protein
MKQFVFPYPMNCTHIYPDGREEKVRYGQYESIDIISENGWAVDRCVPLVVPAYYIEEVVKTNGTKIIFDEPFALIEQSKHSDGRLAKRTF